MEYVKVTQHDGVATVTLARGKVNAINEVVVAELANAFAELAGDRAVSAVVLTGQGKFFSFGFDVPEMYNHTPEAFGRFVRAFCRLYFDLFLFPKPIIAAVNGHAVAGGCIVALACDYRIIANNGARMALNEITFGAGLFAGVVEMLRYAAGSRNAERVLLSGAMYDGRSALEIGLADQLAAPAELLQDAHDKGRELAANHGPAYVCLKNLLKRPVADAWMLREERSIVEWLNIWYSPQTREKAKGIQIR